MGRGEGSEKLHNLYCSSNIVRVIKPRRLRWADQIARMEKDRSFQNFKERKGKRPLGRPRYR